MPLYVRSEEVNDLADLLVKVTGKSKTDAIRDALQEAVEKARSTPTWAERIVDLQSRVRADGFVPMPDQKAFSDELSGHI